jgi:hypothetical protein
MYSIITMPKNYINIYSVPYNVFSRIVRAG